MSKWRIGSLFSGIGALDLAVEVAYGAKTLWQVERAKLPAAVLRRHFGATVIERAIEDVDPSALLAEHGPIDVLCGGFPCQDLSTAGTRAGLDGARSGLYSHVLRFAAALRPSVVVVENVPILFSKYRDRVERDFNALGYGIRWIKCSAAAAGAPHLRRRVFLECTPGASNSVTTVEDQPRAAGWSTPMSRDAKGATHSEKYAATRHTLNLNEQVYAITRWPTPLSTDATKDPKGFPNGGPSLGTPRASDGRGPGSSRARSGVLEGASLPVQVGRLNPDWHAALMGLPPTWTDPNGPSQHAEAVALVRSPKWPSGRGEDQHAWEPPRLVSGPPQRGRPERIKASGNAVVPQAAALALWTF